MPITATSGDTLATIAARTFPNANVRRFTEILDENPDLDVFGDILPGDSLNLPSVDQIEGFARPVLTQISTSIGGAKGFLGQANNILTQIERVLPSELSGYAKDAINVVGELNGAIDAAETVLGDVEEGLRSYGGAGSNLVLWTLSGKR